MGKKEWNSTASVVVSLNVSLKKEIDAETLTSIFLNQDKDLVDFWKFHLTVFFAELPLQFLYRFMKENNITFEMVEKVHSLLPEVLQTKRIGEILNGKLEILHVTGMLDEYYAEMSILQGGKRIRGQEMDLVQDFFKGLRKKLDQIAEQDQNSRAILIVPDSDGILARKCGIRYDYTKAAWYVHKDRLFEISDKWGGHEDHDSFVDRMRRMRKEADQGLDM